MSRSAGSPAVRRHVVEVVHERRRWTMIARSVGRTAHRRVAHVRSRVRRAPSVIVHRGRWRVAHRSTHMSRMWWRHTSLMRLMRHLRSLRLLRLDLMNLGVPLQVRLHREPSSTSRFLAHVGSLTSV